MLGHSFPARNVPNRLAGFTVTDPSPRNPILAAWDRTFDRRASDPALISTAGEVLRTFSDIDTESRELERLFDGDPPRSAIGVQIGNSPSWPALLLALFRRELVPIPVGRHVESAELEAALTTCHAYALITATGSRLHIDRRGGALFAHACDLLKLTSGTGAQPRAVRFQARQLVADCGNICETMGITPGDLNFGVIPMSHSYGFSNLLTPLLCRGVPLVPSEERMPRALLSDLETSGATVLPGMPVFYDKLAALDCPMRLPKLRLCISAGAPLGTQIAETFTERSGLKIHTFYGSSECGGIGYDSSDDPIYEKGYVGTPMRGVEVTPEAPDGLGHIIIGGAAVGDGYFPLGEAESLGNGRFIPGDLVRWTSCGMYIAGRASDIINIAGRKLNPGEVEGRIAEFPGIRQVVVFGVPSPSRGEEPVACVAGDGIDPAALHRFCRQQLSQWQVPRDFWFVREIPTNERGKISRRALAAQFSGSASSIGEEPSSP